MPDAPAEHLINISINKIDHNKPYDMFSNIKFLQNDHVIHSREPWPYKSAVTSQDLRPDDTVVYVIVCYSRLHTSVWKKLLVKSETAIANLIA